MSDEKHSPGPWEVDFKEVQDADGRTVARADWNIHTEDGSAAQWAADARLIAAAPEMLALLREAINGADDCSGWWGGGGRDAFMVRYEALLARIDKP